MPCIEGIPIFHLNAILKIPSIVIQPNMDEIQECLVLAGKYISGVSKGVAQWTAGKPQQVYFDFKQYGNKYHRFI